MTDTIPVKFTDEQNKLIMELFAFAKAPALTAGVAAKLSDVPFADAATEPVYLQLADRMQPSGSLTTSLLDDDLLFLVEHGIVELTGGYSGLTDFGIVLAELYQKPTSPSIRGAREAQIASVIANARSHYLKTQQTRQKAEIEHAASEAALRDILPALGIHYAHITGHIAVVDGIRFSISDVNRPRLRQTTGDFIDANLTVMPVLEKSDLQLLESMVQDARRHNEFRAPLIKMEVQIQQKPVNTGIWRDQAARLAAFLDGIHDRWQAGVEAYRQYKSRQQQLDAAEAAEKERKRLVYESQQAEREAERQRQKEQAAIDAEARKDAALKRYAPFGGTVDLLKHLVSLLEQGLEISATGWLVLSQARFTYQQVGLLDDAGDIDDHGGVGNYDDGSTDDYDDGSGDDLDINPPTFYDDERPPF